MGLKAAALEHANAAGSGLASYVTTTNKATMKCFSKPNEGEMTVSCKFPKTNLLRRESRSSDFTLIIVSQPNATKSSYLVF